MNPCNNVQTITPSNFVVTVPNVPADGQSHTISVAGSANVTLADSGNSLIATIDTGTDHTSAQTPTSFTGTVTLA